MAIYNREDARTALPQLEKKMQEEIDSLKTDYVVEQGSNSYGTYRKWNSGFCECWGKVGIASGFWSNKWTFPCAFADKSKIVIHMTPLDTTSSSWIVNYNTTTVTQAEVTRTPTTSTIYYYISAIGTWK